MKTMKTFKFLSLFVSFAVVFSLIGCSKDDDKPGGGSGDPDTENPILFNTNEIGNGNQHFYIRGTHVLKKGTYILKGWCYIADGAKLTIEEGTIIKGDKETKAALVVEPGGKLIAKGSEQNPIVFTSAQPAGKRKPGDWGGLIVCGKARNNGKKMQIEGGPLTEHGGDDDDDNSGILSYVRVEFAGNPFKADMEINGVTFGSVGRGTQVDHIQVSYSNDDSYEWFGGSVNAKYLVAYHGWDDDFDTDNGFSGKVQFALGIRHPKIADTSLSNGFESDNNKDGAGSNPFTTSVFSNVTFVGPMGQAADFKNSSDYITAGELNPQNGAKTGIFQAAMHIRRNSRLSCFNSVAMGYPVGLLLDNEKGSVDENGNSLNVQTSAGQLLKLNNLVFAQMGVLGSDVNKSLKNEYSADGGKTVDAARESFSASFFASAGNTALDKIDELKLRQPNSLDAAPNYGPMAGSPLIGRSGLFSDVLLANGAYFDKVDYIGAFKSDADVDNWLKSWTNFDPQHTEY